MHGFMLGEGGDIQTSIADSISIVQRQSLKPLQMARSVPLLMHSSPKLRLLNAHSLHVMVTASNAAVKVVTSASVGSKYYGVKTKAADFDS